MMNTHRLIRRLCGKPTCVIAPTAKLLPTARVLNARDKSDYIVIGEHTVVRGELFVFGHGGEINIGSWCYIGEGTRVWSGARVTIGDRVLISHNVNIMDNLTHPLDADARHQQFRAITSHGHPKTIDLGDRPVVIEDDAWIGAGAFVLRGVTIGRGAVVAAGAVVTKNVPALTIVAGNPARRVRALEDGSE